MISHPMCSCVCVYIYKLIYLFLSVLGLRCCPRAFSSCGVRASHCGGFSCCGAWAQLPCRIWNLPRPGTEPMSSALAGRFLTTGPPEKSMPQSSSLQNADNHITFRTSSLSILNEFIPSQNLERWCNERCLFQCRSRYFPPTPLLCLPWFCGRILQF